MSRTNAVLSDQQLATDPDATAGMQRESNLGLDPNTSTNAPGVGRTARVTGGPLPYLLLTALLVLLLMSALATANYRLAPMTYSPAAQADAASTLARGDNYAVFDLNLDTRGLRREHIARLAAKPDIVVLGASHWQEAHADLLPGRNFYNAHVHRDYHDDLLAVTEMLLRHDRLPETLIVSIRDMTFLPEAQRTDALWLTALPDANAMLARLGIAHQPWLETRTLRRWLGLLSLSTMLDNGLRWAGAAVRPGAVEADALPSMDVLQADGSIRWSHEHRAQFTPERTTREVQAALEQRRNLSLEIDPDAVAAIDRMLALLVQRGVRVVLIHPPFNPDFYRQIRDTPYGAGLRRVEAITARLAATHGATLVGSFDPAVAGCEAAAYIDAEHSGPTCLQRLVDLVPGL